MAFPVITVATNSYLNKTDADSYFTNRLASTAWFSAAAGDHERALITASKKISRLLATDYKLGLDPGNITQAMKDATCELAIEMLADNDVITQKNTNQNIKKVGAGPATVEFFRPEKGAKLPDTVMQILKDGSLLASLSFAAGVSSGTDDVSCFSDGDANHLNEALR